MAGIADPRHAGHAGGEPAEEACDRHVRMHQVRLLVAHQPQQGGQRARLLGGREAAHRRQGRDAEPFGADRVEQRAVRTGADHFMAACPGPAHQRQEEVAEREIDVDDFEDFLRWNGSLNQPSSPMGNS